MHKNATKCNKTQSKWCINKHGALKIIVTFETYHRPPQAHTHASKQHHPVPCAHLVVNIGAWKIDSGMCLDCRAAAAPVNGGVVPSMLQVDDPQV
jgi:hypothetical protein